MQKIQNIPNREQEHGQTKTNQDRIQTMTRQGVKGNTQTLITKRGTGEEREEGGSQV